MNPFLSEADLEQAALGWLRDLGYATTFGPDLAPASSRPDRASYADVILLARLRRALERINPHLPADALESAITRVTDSEGGTLLEENRRFHKFVTEGVDVEYRGPDGRPTHAKVWLFAFTDPSKNNRSPIRRRRCEAEFIYSVNRLNVAITRARAKSVVFLPQPLLEGLPRVLDSEDAARGLAYMQNVVNESERQGDVVRFDLGEGVRALVMRAGEVANG